jgi:putative ABC transport system substrate-binding protein
MTSVNQRRLLLLTLGVSLLGDGTLVRSQPSSRGMRRVGVLAPSTQSKDEITLKPFFDQMHALGWVEGQNIAYERLYANDQQEAIGRLAAELVARRPDVILASPSVAALAAKKATQTIPIVFATVPDPVGLGLVESLARPNGNVTGISSMADSLTPKRIELLRLIKPDVKRLGILSDANDPIAKAEQVALAPIAASIGLTIVSAEAANQVEFDAAVAKLMAGGAEAIYPGSVLAYNLRERLIELASKNRVPVIGLRGLWADIGAIFSYGTSLDDQHRRSALVVDKVLKGARPADIPVELPTTFQLVVNVRAAKSLGITIPPSVLLRADRVIE